MSKAYLDHNASSPLRPEAAAAMRAAFEAGNPSSVHGSGRAARRLVEQARADVAALCGCKPEEVIFTSGGSEANDLAINGLAAERALFGATEHDSVLKAKATALLIGVDGEGRIDLANLRQALRQGGGDRVLVSVMLANNETGVLQPVQEIAAAAKASGALLHCDASQYVGKLPVNFASLGVDAMSVSAHKLGGPQGVGALLLREGLSIEPRLRGGGQELGRRAGTENVIGIAGFGAAARAAKDGLGAFAGLALLRDEFERAVLAIAPQAPIWGASADRLPNTSCVGMPGVKAETQVMAFDLAGVEVSAGAACSSGKVRPSHVLTAMGVKPAAAAEAVRISLGWSSRRADVERLIAVWGEFFQRVGARAASAVAA